MARRRLPRRGGRAGRNSDSARAPAAHADDLARAVRLRRALQWRPAGPDASIKGYTVVMRATTSPYWEQEIFAAR